MRLLYLDADDIKELLRDSLFAFVVADVGEKLRWIDLPDRFQFWKNEGKPHLYTRVRPYLVDYPNAYFYVASEWLIEPDQKAILLEKYPYHATIQT